MLVSKLDTVQLNKAASTAAPYSMIPTIVFEGRQYEPEWIRLEVDRVQAGLNGLGLQAGQTVSAMLRNGPEYVVLALACRQAGVYLVTINTHFKAREVQHVLSDSGAAVLFVHDDLLSRIDGGVPTAVVVVTVPSPETAEAAPRDWRAFGAGQPPMPTRGGVLHGAIVYTSGTTGKPKGVRRIPPPMEHAAAMERELLRVTEIVYGTGPGLRAYLAAPIYHSAAMAYMTHVGRMNALLVLENGFDAERALQLIEAHRLTHAYLVPTMYRRLLALPAQVRDRHDISSLRQVASTGSPCPPDLKRRMIEWFGPIITEAYGSSEAGYTTFIDSADWLRHPGSAGRALPSATVRILDVDGRQLPAGETGLIYVKQTALPDFTYVNRPEAREAAERDGLITLGDIGYLDDEGFLYICDRQSDMVISGGVNIYPAEIEAVLQTMPAVADCAVFGIPDAEYGEALAAAVQPTPGMYIEEGAVQTFLRERLAGYKVPRVVEVHDALPREDTGKIFKRRLREPYWRGQQRRI
ncbi:MAG: AMP-binding protein [Burkholderiaceae bacterium]